MFARPVNLTLQQFDGMVSRKETLVPKTWYGCIIKWIYNYLFDTTNMTMKAIWAAVMTEQTRLDNLERQSIRVVTMDERTTQHRRIEYAANLSKSVQYLVPSAMATQLEKTPEMRIWERIAADDGEGVLTEEMLRVPEPPLTAALPKEEDLPTLDASLQALLDHGIPPSPPGSPLGALARMFSSRELAPNLFKPIADYLRVEPKPEFRVYHESCRSLLRRFVYLIREAPLAEESEAAWEVLKIAVDGNCPPRWFDEMAALFRRLTGTSLGPLECTRMAKADFVRTCIVEDHQTSSDHDPQIFSKVVELYGPKLGFTYVSKDPNTATLVYRDWPDLLEKLRARAERLTRSVASMPYSTKIYDALVDGIVRETGLDREKCAAYVADHYFTGAKLTLEGARRLIRIALREQR